MLVRTEVRRYTKQNAFCARLRQVQSEFKVKFYHWGVRSPVSTVNDVEPVGPALLPADKVVSSESREEAHDGAPEHGDPGEDDKDEVGDEFAPSVDSLNGGENVSGSEVLGGGGGNGKSEENEGGEFHLKIIN